MSKKAGTKKGDKLITICARVPRELRDKLEAYRKKHGFRSYNQVLRYLLENLEV